MLQYPYMRNSEVYKMLQMYIQDVEPPLTSRKHDKLGNFPYQHHL